MLGDGSCIERHPGGRGGVGISGAPNLIFEVIAVKAGDNEGRGVIGIEREADIAETVVLSVGDLRHNGRDGGPNVCGGVVAENSTGGCAAIGGQGIAVGEIQITVGGHGGAVRHPSGWQRAGAGNLRPGCAAVAGGIEICSAARGIEADVDVLRRISGSAAVRIEIDEVDAGGTREAADLGEGMTRVGAFPQAAIVGAEKDDIAVERINRDALASGAAIGIAANVEAERGSIPRCAGVGGVEDIAVGSGVFPHVGIKIVGVLRVDGKAEDAEFLILRPISRASRVVADEIEQLGPGGSVVDGLEESANVGACIDNVGIMRIVEDAIDEPAGRDVDVLPGITGGGEQTPLLQALHA